MADQDLGVDIRVWPDLDEDEELAEGMDCLLQDLRLRLDSPQGLADGTEEGLLWGYDLRSNLGENMDARALLEIVVAMEVQAEQDERIDTARAEASWSDTTRTLTVRLDLQAGAGPHSLTLQATSESVRLLERTDA